METKDKLSLVVGAVFVLIVGIIWLVIALEKRDAKQSGEKADWGGAFEMAGIMTQVILIYLGAYLLHICLTKPL